MSESWVQLQALTFSAVWLGNAITLKFSFLFYEKEITSILLKVMRKVSVCFSLDRKIFSEGQKWLVVCCDWHYWYPRTSLRLGYFSSWNILRNVYIHSISSTASDWIFIVFVSCPRWPIICGFPYTTSYFEWLYVLTASSLGAVMNNIWIVES